MRAGKEFQQGKQSVDGEAPADVNEPLAFQYADKHAPIGVHHGEEPHTERISHDACQSVEAGDA